MMVAQADGQIRFGYPVFLNENDDNGFYVGAFGGQLKSKKIVKKLKANLMEALI